MPYNGLCTSCGGVATSDDWDYWNFWVAFNNLEEESDAAPCQECVIEYFAIANPKFDQALMRPETFIAFEHARAIGIDLYPRLSEIDKNEHVQRLASVNLTEIVKWLQSGVFIAEAEEWADRFPTYDEAIQWMNCGFSSYMDTGWLAWGYSPEEVKTLVTKHFPGLRAEHFDYAPPIEYRDFGIELGDAAFFWTSGLMISGKTNKYGWKPEEQIEHFYSSGLPPQEMLYLQFDLQNHPKFSEVRNDDEFWEMLPIAYSWLRSNHTPITADALLDAYLGTDDDEE